MCCCTCVHANWVAPPSVTDALAHAKTVLYYVPGVFASWNVVVCWERKPSMTFPSGGGCCTYLEWGGELSTSEGESRLVLLSSKPLVEEELAISLFRIFAVRASAEQERRQHEQNLKKSETLFRQVKSRWLHLISHQNSAANLLAFLFLLFLNLGDRRCFTYGLWGNAWL